MFVMKKDVAFINSPGIKLIHETATRAKRKEQEIYQLYSNWWENMRVSHTMNKYIIFNINETDSIFDTIIINNASF